MTFTTFHCSVAVDGIGLYAVIITKSLCHILIIDNNTSTSMI